MNRIRLFVAFGIMAIIVFASGTVVFAATFSDVKSDHWAYSTVEWAVKNNVVAGYADGTFKPNKEVTEQEFLAMLIRAFIGEQVAEQGEEWSESYYRIAKEKNYPISNSRSTKIKRQYVAELITATQGKHYVGTDAIQYLLINGLSKGKSYATVTGYASQDTLTRAEAIQFIKNILDGVSSKELLSRPKATSSKDELIIPLPKGSAIGKKNEKLEEIALSIHQAVAPMGYCGFYNGDHGRYNSDFGGVAVAFCADEKYRASSFVSYEKPTHLEYDAIITVSDMLFFKRIGDTNYSEAYINEEMFHAFVETLRVLEIELSQSNKSDIRKVLLSAEGDLKINTTIGSYEATISQMSGLAIEIFLKKK